MKKGRSFFWTVGLFFLWAVAVVQPLASSREPLGRGQTEILDREGRLLFRMERRVRVYFLRSGPLPPKLRPYVNRPLSGPPPLLVATDLSPSQVRDLQGLSGVLVEEYFSPHFWGGEAFKGVLSLLVNQAHLRGRRQTLVLSWELQEALYREAEREGLLGAAVVDLTRGEVLALVPGPRAIFLHTLFPVKPSEVGGRVFGKATGLEVPESLGLYWPGGEALATPLQLARALGARLCGRPPEIHLVKRAGPEVVCRALTKNFETEYIYYKEGLWLRVRLFPEKGPQLALLFLGKGPSELKLSEDLRTQLGVLERQARRSKEKRGFPDLRGFSLRAALEALKGHGVRVDFQGFGRVIRQWPAPGTPWSRVKECRLVLRDET
ncbi:MAG: hypothetical protein DSZ24_06030 [Thermodesulfatator sp.]|nr:MAG: hypothetical protein DSZ24_06030 [Thermodesulfatator sp.]